MNNRGRYAKQRPKKTPPHVSLRTMRNALGLTIDEVIARMVEGDQHEPVSRGQISAIETGHRGVSQELLDALCDAYGIPPGSILTDYEPRVRELVSGDAA